LKYNFIDFYKKLDFSKLPIHPQKILPSQRSKKKIKIFFLKNRKLLPKFLKISKRKKMRGTRDFLSLETFSLEILFTFSIPFFLKNF